MSIPVPDPAELVLCQLPGITASQVLALLAEWGSAAAVLTAPVVALRAVGLPPAVVARVVAAPRQLNSAAAGLKGLTRLGITPLPLAATDYPARLRAMPEPPLVLYVQGAWPLSMPLVAVHATNLWPTELLPVLVAWLDSITVAGMLLGGSGPSIDLLPPAGAVAVVPYGLMLARQRLPAPLRTAVQGAAATVLSCQAVNAPPAEHSLAAARLLLLALADGQLALDTAAVPAADLLPRWLVVAPGAAVTTVPGVPRLRLQPASVRRLARALGLHTAAGTTVQQERLW